MKTIISLFFVLAFVGTLVAQPSIKIGDQTLVLAFAPTNSPDSLREYIPKGESIDHWSRLASVRIFTNETDPADYLDRLGKKVVQTNPAARAQTLVSDMTGDQILDFLMFTKDDKIAEWNLMRARYEKGKGLIVFQYSARFYKIDKNLALAIKAERMKMVDPFAKASFEETN